MVINKLLLLHVLWTITLCSLITAEYYNENPVIPDTFNISKGAIITKPDCPRQCGNLTVPYPFGLGDGSGCGISNWHEFVCNTTFNPPRAFLGDFEIFEISDNQMRMSNLVATTCYARNGSKEKTYTGAIVSVADIGVYSFSGLNKLIVVGCDDLTRIYGSGTGRGNFSSGCVAFCNKVEDVIHGSCTGVGCSHASVPKGFTWFRTTIRGVVNHTDVLSFNPCSHAFLGDPTRFEFRGASDLADRNFAERIENTVPIVVDWWIGNLTCAEAQNVGNYSCKANSHCVNADTGKGSGYRCACNEGFEGNPYLDLGCTDIDECADSASNGCASVCINTPGSFICSCPRGYHGTGRHGVCTANSDSQFLLKATLGFGFGFLALVTALCLVYFGLKKRKTMKRRAMFFHQNGGLLMKQQMSSLDGFVESTKVFTAEQLAKATDNYSEDNILGRGGYGTVYKGILPDKRVVAIKKSRVMEESQVEQFINEIVILTRVNHRNVVRVLGCCLESEVPLLVYEYVSNGTLLEHIQNKGALTWLSWDNRLRIAAESAEALSYLHSAAAFPIIHRDVKSANILLDENYTPKISDFGASRQVALDQIEVTTMVQGTLGYLDPEYFHTSQLTEKSDVYSFGVVLAELLTGKKPIDLENSLEERNLATYLITAMCEKRLFQILEPRVLREGSMDQLQALADLVERCLHLNGEDRPTMKEVAIELEGFRKLNTHPWDHRPVPEESVGLMNENEYGDLYATPKTMTDLYTVPDSSYNNNESFTGQYSLDTSSSTVIFSHVNGPR